MSQERGTIRRADDDPRCPKLSSAKKAPAPLTFEKSAKITQRIHIVMEYTRERSTMVCGFCGEVLESQRAWLQKVSPMPTQDSFSHFLKTHKCFAVKDAQGNPIP